MNNIEAEIAELSQKIAEKRRELEASKGVVEENSLDSLREREIVKSAIGEKISSALPQSSGSTPGATGASPKTQTSSAIPAGQSYLDYLDEESRSIVETLVESVFSEGLAKTLKTLETQEPFIIDAFHDVLTDKIHDELKKQGVIK